MPMCGTKLGLARHRQLGRHPDRPPLNPAVAAGHHLGIGQRHESQQEPAHRRLELSGNRHRLEELVPQPIEDADIEPAEGRAQEGQAHVEGQVAQSLETSEQGRLKIGFGVMNRANVE